MTDDVFLYPGGFHFGAAGTRISTLLGSCVAVCLWHPALRIGGMCHFMLPGRGDGRLASPGRGDGRFASPGRGDGRFADGAFALFRAELARTGTEPGQYRAKVFGGAAQTSGGKVAAANVRAALTLLDRYGFAVLVRDTGGTGARFLRFDLDTGDVWLRRNARGDLDVAS
ncbi:chemotaxis protein CheD [Dactylosporangium sp. CS-033363]|uniref:chemotaxis protein CheD n=1 Tax=Dactylosporangium sp. CS-033363 TaxID=3239935 RepID=UPI003D8F1FE4